MLQYKYILLSCFLSFPLNSALSKSVSLQICCICIYHIHTGGITGGWGGEMNSLLNEINDGRKGAAY
jgi:hypothetical protein